MPTRDMAFVESLNPLSFLHVIVVLGTQDQKKQIDVVASKQKDLKRKVNEGGANVKNTKKKMAQVKKKLNKMKLRYNESEAILGGKESLVITIEVAKGNAEKDKDLTLSRVASMEEELKKVKDQLLASEANAQSLQDKLDKTKEERVVVASTRKEMLQVAYKLAIKRRKNALFGVKLKHGLIGDPGSVRFGVR
ncbi:hypothetical protein REPUB_Repub08aG0115400 [Reevesia pubescens]